MKAYIWTLPTRIFHWMLVFYILLMFITSEEENLLDYHAAFGYGIIILILFRLLWGVMGSRYSRFCQWPLSIKEAIGFVRSLPNPKKYYAGHNPAASFVMLGIILVILLANISGVLAYGIQEGKGLFAWLNGTFFKEMELFEEIHELFSTLLLLLIGAHLGGITVDYFLHKKSGTLSSIFSGYKNIKAPSAHLRPLQKFPFLSNRNSHFLSVLCQTMQRTKNLGQNDASTRSVKICNLWQKPEKSSLRNI